jgi:hypothetical protein
MSTDLTVDYKIGDIVRYSTINGLFKVVKVTDDRWLSIKHKSGTIYYVPSDYVTLVRRPNVISIQFSPWKVVNKDIIISEPKLWENLVKLNETEFQKDITINVYEDTLVTIGAHNILNKYNQKVYQCCCPEMLQYSYSLCNVCKTYSKPLLFYDLRRTFFNLIDRTPNLQWNLYTRTLDDIKGTLIAPKVRYQNKCEKCGQIKGHGHLFGYSCTERFNLTVMVVLNDFDNISKYEKNVIASQPLDIRFIRK